MKDDNYLYGRHPILDAIKADTPISKVFLQQGTTGDFEKELRQLTRERDIPVQHVPKDKLNRMMRGNHQGVLALVAPMQFSQLDALLPFLYESGTTPLVLLLDGVTDVRNLGAIARSAEVLGAHALVVPLKGSALINSDAVKTSAGAIMRLPVCRVRSLTNTVEELQQSGVRIVASTLEGDRELSACDLTGPTALVVGSEDEGVNRAILRRADDRCIIPQSGETDSLNVSVAAGIMLYECARQRRASN